MSQSRFLPLKKCSWVVWGCQHFVQLQVLNYTKIHSVRCSYGRSSQSFRNCLNKCSYSALLQDCSRHCCGSPVPLVNIPKIFTFWRLRPISRFRYSAQLLLRSFVATFSLECKNRTQWLVKKTKMICLRCPHKRSKSPPVKAADLPALLAILGCYPLFWTIIDH